MIEKRIITIPYSRTIQEARYEDIDTGEELESIIVNSLGVERVERKKIYNRTFTPAIVEDAFLEKEIFSVYTLDEYHDFENEQDARNFIL